MDCEEILELEIDWSDGSGRIKCPCGNTVVAKHWVSKCMPCARWRRFKFKSNYDCADGTELVVHEPFAVSRHGELATHVRCAVPKTEKPEKPETPETCPACNSGKWAWRELSATIDMAHGMVLRAECPRCGRELPLAPKPETLPKTEKPKHCDACKPYTDGLLGPRLRVCAVLSGGFITEAECANCGRELPTGRG